MIEHNSIKRYVSKETAIAELRLLLNHPCSKNNVYIVVEGSDDVKLLSKFFINPANLIESYSGCEGVEYIVNTLFSEKQNVIGIRDKDFLDHPSSSKIFFYDYNCIEMMIISNKDIFYTVCIENYEGTKTYEEFFEDILKKLKVVSIIRKINYINGLSINFKTIYYNLLVKKSTEENWNSDVLKALKDGNRFIINEEFEQAVNAVLEEEWDLQCYLNNIQGHDFLLLMKAFCQKECSSKSYDWLGTSIRCCFTIEKFRNTSLYNNLYDYSHRINKQFLV